MTEPNIAITALRKQNVQLKEELKALCTVIALLDEAMASEQRIKLDEEKVGGFVSSLDLTETAEQIVNRAIEWIKIAKHEQGQ